MNVQRTDYRAKEVESLAKADQTDDEDLKHLHTTIANQWRLLAERTETPLANAAASCPTAMPSAPTRSDVGISWAKDDAGLGETNLGRISSAAHQAQSAEDLVTVDGGASETVDEHNSHGDNRGPQVDAGPIEKLGDHIAANHTSATPIGLDTEPIGNQRSNADHDEHFSIEVHLWAQVGPDGGRFETLDEIEQTDPNGALPALNAEGIDSVHGQPSEAERIEILSTSYAGFIETPIDPSVEGLNKQIDVSGSLLGSDAVGTERFHDQLSEIDSNETPTSDPEPIQSPTSARIRPDLERIESVDEQAQTTPSDTVVNSDAERLEPLNDQISHNAVQVRDTRYMENLDGQIANINSISTTLSSDEREHTAENDSNGSEVSPDIAYVRSPADQISEVDQNGTLVGSDPGRFDSLVDQIQQNPNGAAQPEPEQQIPANIGHQSSEIEPNSPQAAPDAVRAESPLEWLLSCWFKPYRW